MLLTAPPSMWVAQVSCGQTLTSWATGKAITGFKLHYGASLLDRSLRLRLAHGAICVVGRCSSTTAWTHRVNIAVHAVNSALFSRDCRAVLGRAPLPSGVALCSFRCIRSTAFLAADIPGTQRSSPQGRGGPRKRHRFCKIHVSLTLGSSHASPRCAYCFDGSPTYVGSMRH